MRTHMVFVCLCLTFLTEHNVLKVHLCCCKWQLILIVNTQGVRRHTFACWIQLAAAHFLPCVDPGAAPEEAEVRPDEIYAL